MTESSERTVSERLRALQLLRPSPEPEAANEIKSAINVTPLVDVVLVLLIIFMVVTPLIGSGVAVDLPRTANHSRKPDDGRDIIVSVTHQERIYLGGKSISRPEDVPKVVAAEQRRNPGKTVFLKADTRAPFGVVRKVMAELHRNDINDVTLGTEELVQHEP